MKVKEIEGLQEYANSFCDNTKISPTYLNHQIAVAIRDEVFTDFLKAFQFLQSIRYNEIEGAMMRIKYLPWAAWQRVDTCGQHPSY